MLVCLLALGIEFRRSEGNGIPHRHGDRADSGKGGADGEGLKGSADAQGLYGNFRFAQDEADAAHAVVDFPVRRAGTLGKHEDALAGFEQADDVFEAGGVRIFLVDGDGLAQGERPFENALEQGFAGKEIDAFLIGDSQHGRVQKALVVADDQHGAVLNELLPVDDLPGEEGLGDAFEQRVENPVEGIHLAESFC